MSVTSASPEQPFLLLYLHRFANASYFTRMDVLRPPLININGRIYRRNIIKEEHYEEEEEFSLMGPSGKSRPIRNIYLQETPDNTVRL